MTDQRKPEPWETVTAVGNVPNMTLHPVLRRAYRVACLIERCGASESLTAASSAAFALVEEIYAALLERPKEARGPSSVVRAGDAFTATFNREPTSPSDAAWLNGYAAALGVPHEPQGWQPIETAPQGHNVLVAYQNKLGKWRIVRACYYKAGTLMTDDSVEEPYCDENGYAHPGWYEECESQEYINRTDEEPVLWHPLPSAPVTKADRP